MTNVPRPASIVLPPGAEYDRARAELAAVAAGYAEALSPTEHAELSAYIDASRAALPPALPAPGEDDYDEDCDWNAPDPAPAPPSEDDGEPCGSAFAPDLPF